MITVIVQLLSEWTTLAATTLSPILVPATRAGVAEETESRGLHSSCGGRLA